MSAEAVRERIEQVAFSPPVFVTAVVVGIALGLFAHRFDEYAEVVVHCFERLLQMCVVPILVAIITLSMGRMAAHAQARSLLRKIALAVPLSAIVVSVIAVTVGLFTAHPHMEPETLARLGILIEGGSPPLTVALEGPATPASDPALYKFLLTIVPANVYDAMATNSVLQIIFFSVLFGLSLGFVKQDSKHTVFAVLEGVLHGFRAIVNGLLLLLPIVLTLTLAADFSRLDFSAVRDLSAVLGSAVVMFLVLTLAGVTLVMLRTRCSWLHAARAMRRVLYVAFTTRDDFASLPSANDALRGLHYGDASEVVMPIAISLCRFGSIAYFALAAVFVSRLYEVPIGPKQFAIAAVMAAVAGVATAGIGEVISLALIGIVLGALGLPLDAALILLLAIDPLIDPFRVMTTVSLGVALAAAFSDPEPQAAVGPDHHFERLESVRAGREAVGTA